MRDIVFDEMKISVWCEKGDSKNDDCYIYREIVVKSDSETVGGFLTDEKVESPESIDLNHDL